MKIKCPHCKSTKGFYTLNDYSNVPVIYDSNGSVVRIDMGANGVKQHTRKYAYCAKCNKAICTVKKLQSQLRAKGSIPNPIAENRKCIGLTQERLAAIIGCSRVTVAHWEANGIMPHKQYIKKMDKLFKNPQFLVEIEEYYG